MFGSFDAYGDIEWLGEGGMGHVWKAVDRNTNRFVAKKYLKSFAPEDRKRFEREARMPFGASGVVIDCIRNASHGGNEDHRPFAAQNVFTISEYNDRNGQSSRPSA